ncbi:MAG: AraC family transcriptional regulator [Hyphomonadaceae bacterium]
MAADGLAVAVCRYGAHERHATHTDTHSRISFLIAGGYREEGKPGQMRMRPGDVLLKSRRAKHEDEFGEDGAVIAAIEFTANDPFDANEAPELWRRRDDAFALRHAIAFLEAAHFADLQAARAAGHDLVAASSRPIAERSAPPWLQRLKRELEDASLASVNVAARALEAGAHPVHASRLFRQCFGASVTEHAQAQSVRRAIAPLADTRETLSNVALAAGFYDQSHMNRIFRRVTGRTPGMMRAVLAAAAG